MAALGGPLLGFAYRVGAQGWTILLFALLTIGCYAMSLAPVTWVTISEVFPTQLRRRGVAISVSAFGSRHFPQLRAASFVFVRGRVPETKGKTLEQIEEDLNA